MTRTARALVAWVLVPVALCATGAVAAPGETAGPRGGEPSAQRLGASPFAPGSAAATAGGVQLDARTAGELLRPLLLAAVCATALALFSARRGQRPRARARRDR